jgi:hypothetical protein
MLLTQRALILSKGKVKTINNNTSVDETEITNSLKLYLPNSYERIISFVKVRR